MDILQKAGMMVAGIGISGLLGAISAVLFLYVLIDAAVASADEVLWVYLAGFFGVIIGGLCFKIVMWASRGQKPIN